MQQASDETAAAVGCISPGKTSAWTEEERAREAEVAECVAAEAGAVGLSEDPAAERPEHVPAWLARVKPGTTIKHQGVVLTVLHIGFADGKFLVLTEPLGLESNSAGQRRARYRELIRKGIGKKAAKRKVREEFATQGDEDEIAEAGE